MKIFFIAGSRSHAIAEVVPATKQDRNNARKLKDYNISDKIRDELLVLGIEIKDNKDGKTSWSVKV